MRHHPRLYLLAAVAAALMLMPAARAFACGNSMSGAETGWGMPGAWLVGLLLHFITLPVVGRSFTGRIASLGLFMGGSTVFALVFDLRIGFHNLIFVLIIPLVLVATVFFYVSKHREATAEAERIRAETAPQVFD